MASLLLYLEPEHIVASQLARGFGVLWGFLVQVEGGGFRGLVVQFPKHAAFAGGKAMGGLGSDGQQILFLISCPSMFRSLSGFNAGSQKKLCIELLCTIGVATTFPTYAKPGPETPQTRNPKEAQEFRLG